MITDKNCFITFCIEVDAIIELCKGFGDYFSKHPKKHRSFPMCNQTNHYPKYKSRKMFIGKKTQNFENLLNILGVKVDSKFLETEYYFTALGERKIFHYSGCAGEIFFDFDIDPTAQIEICNIGLLYPKEQEEAILKIVDDMQQYPIVKNVYRDDVYDYLERNQRWIKNVRTKK